MLVASGVLPHPSNCWGESLGDSSRDGVQSCTVLYSPQCTALHPCPYRHTPASHPHKPHKPPVIIAPSCSACEAEGGCLSSSSINNCYSRGHSRYRLLYSWLLDSQCDSQWIIQFSIKLSDEVEGGGEGWRWWRSCTYSLPRCTQRPPWWSTECLSPVSPPQSPVSADKIHQPCLTQTSPLLNKPNRK